jgi:glycerol-3-phosphate dehydrogenase
VERRPDIRLIKGSHIVLPRLYSGAHAFLLQNQDRRVVFAIPFEEKFTLVGTTDVEWTGPPDQPAISEEEIDYLLATVSRYFRTGASRAEIVWSYSGIRALYDDGTADPSKVARDYVLELDDAGAPLLSVFGGKITTYRRLAEKALGRLAKVLPGAGGAWTRDAVLPGGDIAGLDLDQYTRELADRNRDLPGELVARLARTYGTRAEAMLKDAHSVFDLGEHFGAGLYALEVDHLVANEWARTAEDVLFRRTKLGLHMAPDGVDRLTAYLGRPG